MAAVTVAADNLRADSMDAITNVSGIGGGAGPGVEPDIAYQGATVATAVSRKVGTAQRGFYTTTGATRDMTAARRTTAIMKCAIGNWTALDPQTTPGFRLSIGSGTAAYYSYDQAIFTTYPARGGFVFIAIDPNVATHRDGTTGSPVLTACDYFAIEADFNATSKAENVVMDAVDIGAGLNLTGGDGADADGVFQDFIDADEGTLANRYGYVTSQEGILFALGQLWIGQNTSQVSVNTAFTDSNATVVFPDSLFDAGFSGLSLDLGNASTVVTISSCTFIGRGTTTGVDTRPTHTVTNTSGSSTATACLFLNFASITATTAATYDTCTFEACGTITAAGGDFGGCSISNSTATSALVWDVATNPGGTGGELDNTSFTSAGTGHGLELGTTSPLTIDLNNVDFSGYAGTDGSTGNEAIWVRRTSGTVTINVVGGTTPSIRTDGAIVDVVINPVTTLITVVAADTGSAIQDARVLLLAATGGPLPFEDSVTITRSGSTATVSHTAHGLATNQKVLILGSDQDEYNGVNTITVVDANSYTYTVSGTPTTPATGTITSTAVVLEGLTDVNGQISDTRSYGSNQPITGRARKSSASPYYKTGPITGTISSASGFSVTIQMIPDE